MTIFGRILSDFFNKWRVVGSWALKVSSLGLSRLGVLMLKVWVLNSKVEVSSFFFTNLLSPVDFFENCPLFGSACAILYFLSIFFTIATLACQYTRSLKHRHKKTRALQWAFKNVIFYNFSNQFFWKLLFFDQNWAQWGSWGCWRRFFILETEKNGESSKKLIKLAVLRRKLEPL